MIVKLCDSGHEDICHGSIKCPVCEEKKKTALAMQDVEAVQFKLADATASLTAAEVLIGSLKEDLTRAVNEMQEAKAQLEACRANLSDRPSVADL